MEQQANGSLRSVMSGIALAMSLALTASALGQGALQPGQRASNDGTSRAGGREGSSESAPPPTNIDAQTAKILNEAIELMSMENYAGAKQKIGTLKLDKLSPYERGKVEQILFNIAYSQDQLRRGASALQKAIDSGGLNGRKSTDCAIRCAQLFMQEEKWKEGAAALEEWFKVTATMPNSAAYYLLAVAYYQQDDFNKALAPAQEGRRAHGQSRTRAGCSCSRRCICSAKSTRTRFRSCSSSSPSRRTRRPTGCSSRRSMARWRTIRTRLLSCSSRTRSVS